MLDPRELITSLGGIAQGAHLQQHGISRVRLAKSVREGDVQRLRPGVFATARLCDAARDSRRAVGGTGRARATSGARMTASVDNFSERVAVRVSVIG
ncbi:hypothetical protein WDU99_02785 [Microbacterium sp. Mu-80]|uniref:Type IV toxin-antitoxin system AbiEi family antitoxin domain-containing protein n=1 Tax=Microbacterium bandirmense TaxID=3122050 RepID=A0ABU8L7D6_9MICO